MRHLLLIGLECLRYRCSNDDVRRGARYRTWHCGRSFKSKRCKMPASEAAWREMPTAPASLKSAEEVQVSLLFDYASQLASVRSEVAHCSGSAGSENGTSLQAKRRKAPLTRALWLRRTSKNEKARAISLAIFSSLNHLGAQELCRAECSEKFCALHCLARETRKHMYCADILKARVAFIKGGGEEK